MSLLPGALVGNLVTIRSHRPEAVRRGGITARHDDAERGRFFNVELESPPLDAD
ncbi:hypothetical protein [Desertimonas flava]|uniref:hypothetical protein n=1 Tax=Desertimonas flava TaxID=2064846 RepID=UPI0013C507F5|nr:hypothetical protein [Desertimonas flava]